MPLIILLVTLATACVWTAGPGVTLAAAQAASIYRPVVMPFPVVDSAGRWLEFAFLGGFNAPHPQLADADGDGDVDLFVQEVHGEVGFYAYEGQRRSHVGGTLVMLPRFVLKTAKYGGIDSGEWYRFADVDHDGDLDLLTGQPVNAIRYYRNDGTATKPQFVLAADTLRDTAGAAMFADAHHVPEIGDVDCNGRPDLLINQGTGAVSRYEVVVVSPGAVPTLQLVAKEFEGIKIGGRGQEGDGNNTLTLADYDKDGDLDLFWADSFDPNLQLIPNTGRCSAPNFRNQPQKFLAAEPFAPSGSTAPAFADVNGDGRLDLVFGITGGADNARKTSAQNLYYVERVVADGWVNLTEWPVATTQLLPMIDVGSESTPAVVDLDGDGVLDLLLANKTDPTDSTTSRVYWFKNIGTKRLPVLLFRGALSITAPGRWHATPAFGDLDGDDTLDLVLGGWKDGVAWYRQKKSQFELVDSALVPLTRDSNTTPTLGDLEGDGDLDLLVGKASGGLDYYRNDGTRTKPQFVLVSDIFGGIKAGRRSAPHLADIDGDGDLDLLLGSEADGIALYRNAGTRRAPRFQRDSTFTVPAPALATPATGDFDGDGDLDLIVGGVGGGVVYLERQ